jgi:hypothetical protein
MRHYRSDSAPCAIPPCQQDIYISRVAVTHPYCLATRQAGLALARSFPNLQHRFPSVYLPEAKSLVLALRCAQKWRILRCRSDRQVSGRSFPNILTTVQAGKFATGGTVPVDLPTRKASLDKPIASTVAATIFGGKHA